MTSCNYTTSQHPFIFVVSLLSTLFICLVGLHYVWRIYQKSNDKSLINKNADRVVTKSLASILEGKKMEELSYMTLICYIIGGITFMLSFLLCDSAKMLESLGFLLCSIGHLFILLVFTIRIKHIFKHTMFSVSPILACYIKFMAILIILTAFGNFIDRSFDPNGSDRRSGGITALILGFMIINSVVLLIIYVKKLHNIIEIFLKQFGVINKNHLDKINRSAVNTIDIMNDIMADFMENKNKNNDKNNSINNTTHENVTQNVSHDARAHGDSDGDSVVTKDVQDVDDKTDKVDDNDDAEDVKDGDIADTNDVVNKVDEVDGRGNKILDIYGADINRIREVKSLARLIRDMTKYTILVGFGSFSTIIFVLFIVVLVIVMQLNRVYLVGLFLVDCSINSIRLLLQFEVYKKRYKKTCKSNHQSCENQYTESTNERNKHSGFKLERLHSGEYKIEEAPVQGGIDNIDKFDMGDMRNHASLSIAATPGIEEENNEIMAGQDNDYVENEIELVAQISVELNGNDGMEFDEI